MNLCRQVPTQIITNHSIKLNKVAVENNWNPDEIKWKGARSHLINQIGSQIKQAQTHKIIILS